MPGRTSMGHWLPLRVSGMSKLQRHYWMPERRLMALTGGRRWRKLCTGGNVGVVTLLLERGASVRNLRTAAGLGRMDLLENLFNNDGSLKLEAGKINWPFGEVEKSNLKGKIKAELQARIDQWSNDAKDIINNAFIYACMYNHIEAAKYLLEKGADINAIPPGFDYAGTGLHYAALRGHRAMIDVLLEQGANPR